MTVQYKTVDVSGTVTIVGLYHNVLLGFGVNIAQGQQMQIVLCCTAALAEDDVQAELDAANARIATSTR